MSNPTETLYNCLVAIETSVSTDDVKNEIASMLIDLLTTSQLITFDHLRSLRNCIGERALCASGIIAVKYYKENVIT